MRDEEVFTGDKSQGNKMFDSAEVSSLVQPYQSFSKASISAQTAFGPVSAA